MNEWHLVADEIPANNREVLITINLSEDPKVVAIDCFDESARMFESEVKNRENNMADIFHVVAWMDLPKPYEEDSQ